MKLRKSDLKSIIKECLREIIAEDAQLRNQLVSEALIDLIGGRRRPVNENVESSKHGSESSVRQTLQRQSRQSMQQVAPRVTSHTVQKQSTKRKQYVERDDIFENLMRDTLENTLPKQLSSDMRNPLARSWSDVVHYDANQEDGPASRLAAARVQSNSVQMQHVMNDEHESMPQGLEGLSLSQLREAASSDQHVGTNDASLDMLGLGDRDWSTHVEQGNGAQFDLAAFADELDK